MLSHFPILQVILPLLGAPACLFIGKPRLVWGFALLVSLATLAISIQLLLQVQQLGTISYALGGWDAPWGIEYRIDIVNAYLLLIVSAMGALTLLAARDSVEHEIAPDRQKSFYIAYLLCLAGLLGIIATGDAFNVFVFLEISSLAMYSLIALGRDRRALWAAYQYLILGTVGATFILIGIGFIYMMTGTLNELDLAQRLPGVSTSPTVFAAYAFITVGVCLKLALFPLHFWLPNAYSYAPSIVTAFLAATATKVAVYLLLRFHFTVFGIAFSELQLELKSLFLVLGVVAVFSCSLVALYQPNIKRAIAYSSVAQIGYMIIGVGIGTLIGLQATLLHLFNHALMKGALFLALAAVAYRIGSVELKALEGLGRRMPWTMGAFVIGGLSLIGVPLTVGFVTKWYLVLAALERGFWPLAFLILLGSLLALLYIWRVVETAYFRPAPAGSETTKEAPLSLLVPMWVLALANLYFGIDTRLPVGISAQAAALLFGGEL